MPLFLILVPATNPFLNFRSIKKAFKVLKKNEKFNSIVSIYPSSDQPFQLVKFDYKKTEFGFFKFKKKNFFSFERSQDIPKFYKFSSAQCKLQELNIFSSILRMS